MMEYNVWTLSITILGMGIVVPLGIYIGISLAMKWEDWSDKRKYKKWKKQTGESNPTLFVWIPTIYKEFLEEK